MTPTERTAREIAHGRRLAEGEPESVWGWSSAAGRLRAERRAKLILEGAHVHIASRVLEVGCGSGVFTEKFARSGSTIVAVDVSPELIAMAEARGLKRQRVRFVQESLEDFQCVQPFDAVVGSSVLHHLEIGAALRKVYSLLKPGGWMSFAEPNLLNPQIFMERKFRRLFPSVSPDETAFRRGHLTSDLFAAGFDCVRVTPFDWLHPATPEWLIPTVQSLGRFLEQVWPIREFAGSLLITARRPLPGTS